jgi:hypothetical protein
MDAALERALVRLPDVMDRILEEIGDSREERRENRRWQDSTLAENREWQESTLAENREWQEATLAEIRAEREEFLEWMRADREESREFMRQLTLRHERVVRDIDGSMQTIAKELKNMGAELRDMGDQIRANTAAVFKILDRLDNGHAAA